MRAMSLVIGVDVFVLGNGIENHIHDASPAGDTPLERDHHLQLRNWLDSVRAPLHQLSATSYDILYPLLVSLTR